MQNREIKFRGISKETKKTVFGCLVNNMWTYSELTQREGEKVCEIITGEYGGDCWEEAVFEDGCIVTVIPESVGQFINSKDADGKEIFEGDILQAPAGNMFEVKWHDEELRWAMYRSDTFYNMNCRLLKVVGNIYKNPELLIS